MYMYDNQGIMEDHQVDGMVEVQEIVIYQVVEEPQILELKQMIYIQDLQQLVVEVHLVVIIPDLLEEPAEVYRVIMVMEIEVVQLVEHKHLDIHLEQEEPVLETSEEPVVVAGMVVIHTDMMAIILIVLPQPEVAQDLY